MTRLTVGNVSELWRYPVKSMGGELLDACDLQIYGISGDRAWAVKDEDRAEISGAKRIPRLMMCRASYSGNLENGHIPHTLITLPDGVQRSTDQTDVHAALSRFLDRNITLWPLQGPDNNDHYRLAQSVSLQDIRRQLGIDDHESNPDFSEMPLSLLHKLSKFVTLPGTYFDAYPLHVITTASLETLQHHQPTGSFDTRRFRPNILIETGKQISGLAEFSWCGGMLSIGSAVIKCEVKTIRCAMPSYPQPDLEKDTSVLQTVRDVAERHLGIYASIIEPGRIRVGDSVTLTYPKFLRSRNNFAKIKKQMKRRILDLWSKSLSENLL